MKQLFVVEGNHDLAKLKAIDPNLNVITTNGSAVSKELIDTLIQLAKEFEIILLLDPDFPGQKIRDTIQKSLPTVSHIFIEKKYSIDVAKNKVGIEHVEKEILAKKLSEIVRVSKRSQSLQMIDLYLLGLIGNAHSGQLRAKVSNYYTIGHVNGKILLERLNWLELTKDDLIKTLKKVDKDA